jgi:hypothetical protein
VSSRSKALYSAISLDVSAVSGLGPVAPSELPPDVSYRQAAGSVLLSTLLKKYLPEDTSDPDAKAVEKFLASNKKCRDWKLSLQDSLDELLFLELKSQVDNFLHPGGTELVSSMFDILKHARTGPGSAIGAKANSFYAKLCSSSLTTTSRDLYDEYKNYVQWFTLFSEAEVHRYERFGEPAIVNSSRFHLVPKTKDISRMICVEPSLNMYYQLGLGAILESRLRDYFQIDLKRQPSENRALAYRGSIDSSFSTIDLASASDSISLRLCEEIFPQWFFELLLRLRVSSTMIDQKRVGLYMISTMGNGFTFPLQTVIFSCLIRAAYSVACIPLERGCTKNWACFGDDIIVEAKAFRYVSRLLTLLGFEMNSTKTFSEGPFRESCGADWFYGQPIRGVYVKSLASQQDILITINLLNCWSAYTGIPLINGINYLVSCLHRRNNVYVPFDENNDAGIRVPSILLPGRVRRDSNLSIMYRVFRSRGVFFRVGDGEIRSPIGLKKLHYNPSGLLMSLLLGELRSGKISTRHRRVRYHMRWRCTPFWDYIPKDSLTNGYRLSWQQWETAVLINFSNP